MWYEDTFGCALETRICGPCFIPEMVNAVEAKVRSKIFLVLVFARFTISAPIRPRNEITMNVGHAMLHVHEEREEYSGRLARLEKCPV